MVNQGFRLCIVSRHIRGASFNLGGTKGYDTSKDIHQLPYEHVGGAEWRRAGYLCLRKIWGCTLLFIQTHTISSRQGQVTILRADFIEDQAASAQLAVDTTILDMKKVIF